MNALCVIGCIKYKSLKYNQTLNSGILHQKKKSFLIQDFALCNLVFRCWYYATFNQNIPKSSAIPFKAHSFSFFNRWFSFLPSFSTIQSLV